MKKKIRHITVNGQKFNWRVISADSENVLVKIWIDGFKRLPWLEATFPFKDPWLNLADLAEKNNGSHDASNDNLWKGITPKNVSTIIETVTKDIGIPPEVKKTISLNWCPKSLKPSYAIG